MNLLKSLAAVSSITMISRVLGFVRDTLLARIFGASMATDAFFIAFKLPNLLRRIFAEGAFSQAFVPILAEYKTQQGEEATRTFIAYVSGLLTLVLMLVTLIGMLAAPWVIWATAPGFANTPEKFALTTDLLRVTFPYILLISLSSLAGAILNTWNRFSVPAFVPTLLNVSMIVFALFLTPYFEPPVMALGWAVLAGGLAQLLYQLPHLKKIGMLVLPRLNLKDTGVWRVMRNMLPAILGVSVSQISLIINTAFASLLVSGSVSWMYYADRLMELPSGVLGVALGTILLPTLARTYASKDRQEYSRILDWGLRLCFVLVLPCALALAISAGACINAGLLFYQLRKQQMFQPQPGWGLFALKLLVAVAMMSAVLLGLMHVMPAWSEGHMLERFMRLGVLVVAGVVVYFGMLLLQGFRLRDFNRKSLS